MSIYDNLQISDCCHFGVFQTLLTHQSTTLTGMLRYPEIYYARDDFHRTRLTCKTSLSRLARSLFPSAIPAASFKRRFIVLQRPEKDDFQLALKTYVCTATPTGCLGLEQQATQPMGEVVPNQGFECKHAFTSIQSLIGPLIVEFVTKKA